MVASTRAAAAVSSVLDHRLDQLQKLTGLPMVFGGPVERTATSQQLVITRLRGNFTDALHDVVVPPGRGLGGISQIHVRPFVVSDYARSRSITHHYDREVVDAEGITAIFAYPVVVRGRVESVLYGASRDGVTIGDLALKAAATVSDLIAGDVDRLLALPRPEVPPLTTAQALSELEAIAGRLVDPALRARLLRAHRSLVAGADEAVGNPSPNPLSPRETDCLELAAIGATNATIARELGLTPGTVKAYLRSVMTKLEVHNRTAAVHVARTSGLI